PRLPWSVRGSVNDSKVAARGFRIAGFAFFFLRSPRRPHPVFHDSPSGGLQFLPDCEFPLPAETPGPPRHPTIPPAAQPRWPGSEGERLRRACDELST